jgi:hypothetical protein
MNTGLPLTFHTMDIAIIDSQKNHSQITLVLEFLATHFIVGQMIYTYLGYLL